MAWKISLSSVQFVANTHAVQKSGTLTKLSAGGLLAANNAVLITDVIHCIVLANLKRTLHVCSCTLVTYECVGKLLTTYD